jgi:hypothetical protein
MCHGKVFIEIEALKEAFLSLVRAVEPSQDKAMVKMHDGAQRLLRQGLPAKFRGRREVSRIGTRPDLVEEIA